MVWGWEGHTSKFKMCPIGNKGFTKFTHSNVSQIYTGLENICPLNFLLCYFRNHSLRKQYKAKIEKDMFKDNLITVQDLNVHWGKQNLQE